MTPVDPHVDLVTLADHLEGLLDDIESAEVSDHVATCPVCAARVDDLRGVSEVLAREPAQPMPPEVERRIEQAVDAEVVGSTGTVAALDERRARASLRRQKGRSKAGRALLVAAAAVVVVGVGGTLLDNAGLSGGAGDDEGAGSAGESAVQADRPSTEAAPSGENRRDSSDDLDGAATAYAPPDTVLIERVFATRADTPRRDRAVCVAEALDDIDWRGTSYSVQTRGQPGAVAFLDTGADTVEGVLITCQPVPSVQERRPLTR